jgi:3-hydroxyanthranilate 3,4-dioxygenase
MTVALPLNLQKWIADHRERLKPPVGNAQVFEADDFLVSIIGGPNARTDYHDDPYEEIFYQLKGDVVIRIQDDGRVRDIPLKEGDMWLLPAHVRHSPQRAAGTIGMIVERIRPKGVKEAFEWYCDKCNHLLGRVEIDMASLDEMPGVFNRYYADTARHTCTKCGHVHRYARR